MSDRGLLPDENVIESRPNNKAFQPRAWLIKDFSKDPKELKQFRITVNPIELARQLRSGEDVDYKALTKADRWLHGVSTRLKRDPIGQEDFHTILDVGNPEGNGPSGSLHEMLLGARQEQNLHYHPPAAKDDSTSIRQVLLYALDNAAEDAQSNDGITFEWFALDNSGIQKLDSDDYPTAQGTPVSPKHIVRAKPGQVVLVEFGKGVHRFGGMGYALSAHFNDKDNGSNLGSFLGNTAQWDETASPAPIKEYEVELSKIDGRKRPKVPFNALALLATRHTSMLRDRIEGHVADAAGTPLTPQNRTGLIHELRNG